MAVESLEDLFLEGLKDIYFAEKQILRALPKMIKSAEGDTLRDAFERHRDETEGQIERLDAVFETMGTKAKGKTCPAIMGIIEEAQEIMKEVEDADVRDAGMVGAAQAVEHYEIARYGTLIAWARRLGNKKAAKLLEETLEEEKNTDRLLTEVAEEAVNADAEKGSAMSEDGDEGEDETDRSGRGAGRRTTRAAASTRQPPTRKSQARKPAAKKRAAR
jgi:ferritin-like metal-binding protein YciE